MSLDHHPLHSFTSLTAFRRDLLFTMARLGPAKGLEIKASLEELRGGDVNHGQLYPNLDRMVGSGYVEKSELDGRSNEYSLTGKAHDEMIAYLEWQVACHE